MSDTRDIAGFLFDMNDDGDCELFKDVYTYVTMVEVEVYVEDEDGELLS